nr:hypothetical protein [Tanacetum cinerariifolium]
MLVQAQANMGEDCSSKGDFKFEKESQEIGEEIEVRNSWAEKFVQEPLKMKKKDQISFDEQEARRLQAEIDEQDRLAKEEAQKALEANIVVIEQWHDV